MRRRKTKYVWLPNQGVDVPSAEDETQDFVSFTEQVNVTGVANLAPSVGFITNVLEDVPRKEVDNQTTSLADNIGSEYFLKRIVGKVWISTTAEIGNSGQTVLAQSDLPSILVTCGFFIAPELPQTTGSGAQGVPVGPADFYNPQLVGAIQQPWIWRRSWIFTAGGSESGFPYLPPAGGVGNNIGVGNGSIFGSSSFPSNNVRYGSVLDGPHIDAKTARRVRQHERLFFCSFGHSIPEGRDFVTEGNFQSVHFRVTLDVRCLGALRRAHNKSSFE